MLARRTLLKALLALPAAALATVLPTKSAPAAVPLDSPDQLVITIPDRDGFTWTVNAHHGCSVMTSGRTVRLPDGGTLHMIGGGGGAVP